MMTREISRQAFVRGALGAAAVGVLGACGRPAAPGQAEPTVSQPTSSPPGWAALADAIDGSVTLPSDAGYPAAKGLFNTRFVDATPAAVVTVKSNADVRKAVAFAAENDVKITTRSGGHSYVGASAANGTMVIDVRSLPGGITYDAGSGLAKVSAATDVISVQTALASHGRSIPAGSCPTVGVAGLTLGGGLGSDARRCGLTCDAMVSASVVLPGGELVTASPDEHADLYWALRGGGANIGIATSFTFRTHQTSDRDVVTLEFPESAAAHTIFGWHDWLTSADRTIWSMVNLTVGPTSGRCGVVLATSAGDGPRTARALAAAIGVQPTDNTSRTLGHMDFVHYFTGGPDAVKPRAFVAGSDIVAEMTSDAAESIVAATSAWPTAVGSATTVIESLDGAVRDVNSGDTAFPWRRQAACVQWYVETPSPATVEAADGWLAGAHRAVRAHSSGGYVNYLEPKTPPVRYFGDNVARLDAVRQHYDPGASMYHAT
ncbi:MAG: FAD-binding oxidoreductase [Mycobacterium sp.]